MLSAWLLVGHQAPNSSDHVRLCKPSFVARREARHMLAVEPVSLALFQAERVQRDDEGSEPEGLA